MATELEPLPRKFHHAITNADTMALARRFWSVVDRHPDMPVVVSFDVDACRSTVRFSPGGNYTTSTARNVAAWAHALQVPMQIALSSTHIVNAVARIDATEDVGEVFDVDVSMYLGSGTGRLLSWMVRDHLHPRDGDGHTCPHCGHDGGISLASISDGGTFECDPAVFCIAYDNAYAEYTRMASVGKWVSIDQAMNLGTREAVFGALFQAQYEGEQAAAKRRAALSGASGT